jgi:cytochrome c biogenesis protein CcdA
MRIPPEVLVLLLLVGAVLDLGLLPVRLPSRGSVPKKWWIAHGPVKASAMYGLVLGLGVTTFVPFATFYSLLVSAAYLGPIPGLLVGAAYGLGRAVPVWVASIAIAGGRRPMAGQPNGFFWRVEALWLHAQSDCWAVAVTGWLGLRYRAVDLSYGIPKRDRY